MEATGQSGVLNASLPLQIHELCRVLPMICEKDLSIVSQYATLVTGNVSFGLPIMIVLMVAKWIGDLFTEGIYDEHIGLAKVPLLGWEAPPITSGRRAIEIMSTPVTVFRPVEKVSVILKYLKVSDGKYFVSITDPRVNRRTPFKMTKTNLSHK